MDALGATGMAHFASQIVRKSYAVYSDTAMNADIERAVERQRRWSVTSCYTFRG